MKTPTLSSKNELQCLTGHLTALGRLIAQFTEKLRLFFLTLKGANATGWTNDYEQAFKEIERYLTQPSHLEHP